MKLTVNGEATDWSEAAAEGLSVSQLLAHLGVKTEAVAVAVNLEVVPRGQHATHSLCDGDRVEVVRAVGGG